MSRGVGTAGLSDRDVRALLAGGQAIYRRHEPETLGWVAGGKRNDDIASLLGARPATVAKHLERVYKKLGVATRTEAAVRALSIGRRAP